VHCSDMLSSRGQAGLKEIILASSVCLRPAFELFILAS